MKRLVKSIGAACLAIVATAHGPAMADDGAKPLILEPTSTWQLNYADDSCQLARMFGEGEQKSAFLIERYEPGDAFFLLAAGSPLDSRNSTKTVFRFGPAGREYDGPSQVGTWVNAPAVMITKMSLLPLSDHEEGERRRSKFDPEKQAQDTDIFGQELSAEQETAIEWLEIERGRSPPVRFSLGSMGAPLEAMRKCTDELLTHWGIDIEAHRGLTRAVAPRSNPGNWLTFRDYPSELLRKGAQGIVQFRLSVGSDGSPTQCHIQKSTRPAGFDATVCKALMKKARFEPALGRDGQPIASFWRSSVRFEIPG